MFDQVGSFQVSVNCVVVQYVQVVDVDMVLYMVDGIKVVLVGGVMEVMDDKFKVRFVDISVDIGKLFDIVGKILFKLNDQLCVFNFDLVVFVFNVVLVQQVMVDCNLVSVGSEGVIQFVQIISDNVVLLISSSGMGKIVNFIGLLMVGDISYLIVISMVVVVVVL